VACLSELSCECEPGRRGAWDIAEGDTAIAAHLPLDFRRRRAARPGRERHRLARLNRLVGGIAGDGGWKGDCKRGRLAGRCAEGISEKDAVELATVALIGR